MAAASETLIVPKTSQAPNARIVFTEGGKGGVGKTAFASLLVEWYESHNVPHVLLDLDYENMGKGSLSHYFKNTRKIDINRPESLDALVDLTEESPIVVADMGASAGKVAHQWFRTMHDVVHNMGVAFTAIGVILPDPGSIASILTWASALQKRCQYLIVKNEKEEPSDWSYWDNDEHAELFRKTFRSEEITMACRLAWMEHAMREHGIPMKTVAERKAPLAELTKSMSVARAQTYRHHMFAQLDRVKDILLLA